MSCYDAIVLGLGAVGSSAAYHLARRGLNVLGLDAHQPPHDRGSSHGESRIIRQAYFEHPDYVPLLTEAYRAWSELEAATGETLYIETGLLEIGPPDGEVITGVLTAKQQHDLEVDEIEPAEFDFPGLVMPEDSVVVFERRAGILPVEKCVAAHLQMATSCGANLQFNQPVVDLELSSGEVIVSTATETYRGAALVLAAGAWSARWLRRLPNFRPPALTVTRAHQHWFANTDPRYRLDAGFPVFLYERPEGMFYGFPQLNDRDVKLAAHAGYETVDDADQLNRSIDEIDQAAVAKFAAQFLPGLSSRSTRHVACMYTNTVDHHFRIDRIGEKPAVAIAAGLSGHGFKFTSILGEALADLTISGETKLPIGFLRC